MNHSQYDLALNEVARRAIAALRRENLIQVNDDGSAVVRFPADAIDRADDLLWVAAASETHLAHEIAVTAAVYPVQSLRLNDRSPNRAVAEVIFRFDLACDEVTGRARFSFHDLYVDRIASLAPTRHAV